MDEKSRRRLKRYFDITSLVGENQSTAIVIPHDPAFNDAQNQQRAKVMHARLRLLGGDVGTLEARVRGGSTRSLFVVRSATGHDPYGFRPSRKACDAERFRQAILKLGLDFRLHSFLLAAPRRPIERIYVSISGECASDQLEDFTALSDALLSWIEPMQEITSLKVKEMMRLPDTLFGKWALSILAKKDWRLVWENADT